MLKEQYYSLSNPCSTQSTKHLSLNTKGHSSAFSEFATKIKMVTLMIKNYANFKPRFSKQSCKRNILLHWRKFWFLNAMNMMKANLKKVLAIRHLLLCRRFWFRKWSNRLAGIFSDTLATMTNCRSNPVFMRMDPLLMKILKIVKISNYLRIQDNI